MGRALELEHKVCLLKMILENKKNMFGQFSPHLTNSEKQAAWDEVAEKGKAMGIYSHSGNYLRETTWQNWRKRAVVIANKIQNVEFVLHNL